MVGLARAVLLVAIVGGALTGCGRKEEAATPVPDTPTVAVEGLNEVFGGCWTTDQVGSDDQGRPQFTAPPANVIDPARRYIATLATSKGAFDIELLATEAPIAVNNFVCLARSGYYDGTPFHRIFAGFVIQGGDPTGTGGGGPGYQFADETPARPYARGTVAMANSGPNTNGSQFFVCLDDLSQRLAPSYTLFGNVISGMEAVDLIAAVPTTPNAQGEPSVPTELVTLDQMVITEQ